MQNYAVSKFLPNKFTPNCSQLSKKTEKNTKRNVFSQNSHCRKCSISFYEVMEARDWKQDFLQLAGSIIPSLNKISKKSTNLEGNGNIVTLPLPSLPPCWNVFYWKRLTRFSLWFLTFVYPYGKGWLARLRKVDGFHWKGCLFPEKIDNN